MATKFNKASALKQLDDLKKKQLDLEKLIKDNETTGTIMDKVKTFKDAFTIHKKIWGAPTKEVQALLNYKGTDKLTIAAQGYVEIDIVRSVLNEGWLPDWEDGNYKYYPWFKHSGSGLSYFDCASVSSGSAVGSRLCFKSRELAEYAGKQFIDIYSKFHTI